MSREFDLQKFIKDHPNGCPHENRRCDHINMELCDPCIENLMKTEVIPVEVAVSGGRACKADDVQPTQEFKVSSSVPICQGCQKPEGSNACCKICASFQESYETARNGDQNPDIPVSIQFQEGVGPRLEDLCALTPEEVEKSVHLLRCVFMSMVLPLIPVASSIPNSHVGLWRGCEWSSGNCWLVVILQMFQTGSWNTSINVSNPLGNALWILVHKLRTTGFLSRQELQAFRRLMAEIIGQHERGTLFENGQMDPLEALRMLENNGAFRYDYSLSSERFIKGIHATPVIDLGLLQSPSTNLIEKIGALNIDIELKKESKFSCLPSTLVIKVSSPEQMPGSTVDFPLDAVFGIGHLTFQVESIMIIIGGHYMTVFIRLKYNPQTETVYTTYLLSDSKSDVKDCGHHIPSIVEIKQRRFDELWRDHAISMTCSRIPKIVQIDGIPHEWDGAYFKPLMPASESLPQCDEGQYTTFGPNREILIKQCMSPLEFQKASLPLQSAPCAQVAPVHPPPPQASCAQVAWVSPPPPLPLCAQVGWVPPPPPPAPCVSGPSVPPHQPPPQCEQVVQALLQPPLPCAEVDSSLPQGLVRCPNDSIIFYRSHLVVETDKSNKKREFMPIQIRIGKNPTFLLSAEHHHNHYVVDGTCYTSQKFFDYVHHMYMQFLREI